MSSEFRAPLVWCPQSPSMDGHTMRRALILTAALGTFLTGLGCKQHIAGRSDCTYSPSNYQLKTALQSVPHGRGYNDFPNCCANVLSRRRGARRDACGLVEHSQLNRVFVGQIENMLHALVNTVYSKQIIHSPRSVGERLCLTITSTKKS